LRGSEGIRNQKRKSSVLKTVGTPCHAEKKKEKNGRGWGGTKILLKGAMGSPKANPGFEPASREKE